MNPAQILYNSFLPGPMPPRLVKPAPSKRAALDRAIGARATRLDVTPEPYAWPKSKGHPRPSSSYRGERRNAERLARRDAKRARREPMRLAA